MRTELQARQPVTGVFPTSHAGRGNQELLPLVQDGAGEAQEPRAGRHRPCPYSMPLPFYCDLQLLQGTSSVPVSAFLVASVTTPAETRCGTYWSHVASVQKVRGSSGAHQPQRGPFHTGPAPSVKAPPQASWSSLLSLWLWITVAVGVPSWV